MTKKLEVVWLIGCTLSAIGIIGWWYFGLNKDIETATWSIVFSGVCALIALLSKGLAVLRRRNGAID